MASARPDPFDWLEEESEDVRAWQREQSTRATTHVTSWSHHGEVRELAAHYSLEQRHGEQYTALPRFAGGLWFRTVSLAGVSQSAVMVSSEPMGEGRILFNPLQENPSRPPFVSWLAPSPDGRILALGVCTDGSENNTVRLIDVGSGATLPGAPTRSLMDSWTGGVQWLPDSSGFLFAGLEGRGERFEQEIFLHRLNPARTDLCTGIPWTSEQDYRWVTVARDGGHAVAMEGLVEPRPLAVADLGETSPRWRPFVTAVAGKLCGHLVGDQYVAVTDVDAPQGRVVAIPLDAADPNDPPLVRTGTRVRLRDADPHDCRRVSSRRYLFQAKGHSASRGDTRCTAHCPRAILTGFSSPSRR